MTLNVKQLASKLKVSSPAIIQHYEKNRSKIGRHSVKIKNQRLFDNVAIIIIRNSFKIRKSPNKAMTDFNKLVLQSYKEQVTELKAELNNKNENVIKLEELLNQQQTLNLNTQKELKSTQERLRLKYKKHSWFWRLFH